MPSRWSFTTLSPRCSVRSYGSLQRTPYETRLHLPVYTPTPRRKACTRSMTKPFTTVSCLYVDCQLVGTRAVMQSTHGSGACMTFKFRAFACLDMPLEYSALNRFWTYFDDPRPPDRTIYF